MAIEKPLTIRDYLDGPAAGSRAGKGAKRRLQPFKEALAREKESAAAPTTRGLTIADYFSQRVILSHSSPSRAAGPPADAATRSPQSPGSAETFSAAGRSGALSSKSNLRLQAQSRQIQPQSEAESVERSIQKAASRYNLAPELIRSVIRVESGFRADAVSPAGAKGLMQLMPETASDLGVTDPFNVVQNIDGGARYLRQMLDRFGGRLDLALAAYNAGPGAVEKHDGRVPYPETREYVKRVMRFAGLKA
jgi:soluble lytic murein transglycosylase-like protein